MLCGFVAVGINNIHNSAFIGQDFSVHVICTEHLMGHPGQWFSFDYTNRPVPYWIGVACSWFTHGKAPWELAALIFVILNALGLHLLHDGARRFIGSPLLRVAVVGFVAFLPSMLVTTVVYAADTVAQLPFALAAWSLLRSAEASTTRACAGYAALAGITLWMGNLAKFTFILLPVAVILIIAILWRWKRIAWRRGLLIGGLAAVVPMIGGGWIYYAARRDVAKEPARHLIDWKGTGEMTWRSVLRVKRSDVRIFQAPGYWDPPPVNGGCLPLLANNSYSYPALFHLAVFTDVLDYANQGSLDNGTPRPEPQKIFSRVAVWLGLLFSVPAFLAVMAFGGRTFLALVWPQKAPATGVFIWGVMALVWYLPLVYVLPYLHNAYEWGYWLPRLVMPALWGFALVLFSSVDELAAKRRHSRPRHCGSRAAPGWRAHSQRMVLSALQSATSHGAESLVIIIMITAGAALGDRHSLVHPAP